MKTLIYTTFFVKNKKYESLIWEWLISLRTLGNYKGEVIIFDYGLSDTLVEELNKFKLGPPRIIKLKNRHLYNISNWRNIDVIPHLEEYKDYSFAHFDADIWFQKEVNIMFEELENINGCYLAIEKHRSCRYRGPVEFESDNFKTQQKLQGFVFGGWIAGKYEPYINKLKQMKQLFNENNGWDIKVWGTDQSMITHIVDFENDNLDGLIYGCSHYFCREKDNLLKCVSSYDDTDGTDGTNTFNYQHENKDAVGVHLIAFGSIGSDTEKYFFKFRFKYRYPELWEKHR